MAILGIATTWWHALCMHCSASWGIWMEEPGKEPYCYQCGVHAMVLEGTLSTDPPGDDIKVLFHLPYSHDDECITLRQFKGV